MTYVTRHQRRLAAIVRARVWWTTTPAVRAMAVRPLYVFGRGDRG